MKIVKFGYVSENDYTTIKNKVDGKSYIKINVLAEIRPEGKYISFTTESDVSEEDILKMIILLLL